MTVTNQYFKVLLLAFISLISGVVLFGFGQFSYLFFDANIFDVCLLVLFFILPVAIYLKYRFVDKLPMLAVLLACLGMTALNYWIREAILRFPNVLNLVVYLHLILLGMGVVLAGRLVAIMHRYSKAIFVLAFVAAGSVLGYNGLPSYWLTSLALLSLVVLFFTIDCRRHYGILVLFSSMATGIVYAYFHVPEEKVYASQVKFHDKVVFSTQTPFQQIDVTSWKGNRWYYFNGTNQFSTLDEWMYYEPLIHPVMQLARIRDRVLVLGGENGIIARELVKYQEIDQIDILPLDTAFYRIARHHEMFRSINQDALSFSKVNRKSGDLLRYLDAVQDLYDVMIIDLPDPVDLELNQYYTKEFYNLCKGALKPDGILVTQSGSPYYATKAFYAVGKTMESAGFHILPLHNQVISLGEWGWTVGSVVLKSDELRQRCEGMEFKDIDTRWLNQEAMNMMMSFGKPYTIAGSIEVNTLKNPVIHQYYNAGTWRFD